MTDRRRANRFVLSERVHGSLRIMEDVYVERVTAADITVVVGRPPAVDEDLLLELAPHGGRRRVLRVRALRGGLHGLAEPSRFRVTLVPSAGERFGPEASPGGRWHTEASPGLGVLVRRIPMTLGEVSAKGCLIESRHRLPEGTVGVLEVMTPLGTTAEQLRICRMVRIVGGALPYSAGAEFLPLGPPTPASVRNLIARLEMVLDLDSASTITLGEDLPHSAHCDTARPDGDGTPLMDTGD